MAIFAHIAASAAKIFNLDKSTDKELKNILKRLTLLGDSSLPSDELKELTTITNYMGSVYSTGYICFDPEKEIEEYAVLKGARCPTSMQMMLEPGWYIF